MHAFRHVYDSGSRFANPSPNPCDCAHFSHMSAPEPSTVTRISSQTHPILVTVDTFKPRLRHEGMKSATATRIAFLTGPVPVTVDPRKEQDDDYDEDEENDDDDDTNPLTNYTTRPKP